MSKNPELSVVVPLLNEEANVHLLVDEVCRALGSTLSWELILVDDGSEDATARIAAELSEQDPRVRLVALASNCGQTTAMQAGFDLSRGRVVVSMDGDLQNDPADIPRLIAKLDEGYSLVAGYRERRRDKWLTRKVPSWIANRLIRWITGVPITDNGCSLKAYRRELLDRMRLYSDMHRFIPAVAAGTAGASIAEIPVRHHPRRFGRSKYGLSRIGKVLVDLLTIKMIGSFRDRPLQMFGIGALGSSAVGLLFTLATALATTFGPEKASTLVFAAGALLWFGLASHLLMLGLIAEVAVQGELTGTPGNHPIAREVM